MILALLLTVIFLILGFTMVSMEGLESRQAAQAEYSLKALYMADAGVQFAVAVLTNPLDNLLRPIQGGSCCPYPCVGTKPPACVSCTGLTNCPTSCPGGGCGGPLCSCTNIQTKWIESEGVMDEGFTDTIGGYIPPSPAEYCQPTGGCVLGTNCWCYQVRSTGTIENRTLSPATVTAQRVLKAYILLRCVSGCASGNPACPTGSCTYSATVEAQYEDFK